MSETKQDKRWKKLMTRAQYGDEESYTLLMGEIYPVVGRYLVSKLGVFGYDDEVNHECLFALHLARHTYDPVRPFAPWMYAVVRYKAIELLKKNEGLWKKKPADGETDPPTAPSKPIASEDMDRIQRALEDLSDENRRAVVLTQIEGMASDDAAQVEDISELELRQRVSAAFKTVRKQLESDFGY